MTENGTVFFRGIDMAGNVSDVAKYEVTNIDKIAPEAEKTGNRKRETDDATPAPRKRGRPRKAPPSDAVDPVALETGKPETGKAALVDAETATFDVYQREEPLPADDAASAPSGAPIAETSSLSEEPLLEML